MKKTNLSNINSKSYESNESTFTIYNAIKNTIENTLNCRCFCLDELKLAIDNNLICVSENYQTECFLYAKKVLSRTNNYYDTLNRAYSFSSYKNEDLVSEMALHLMGKFKYLINKYYDLHTQYKDENIIARKFSAIVSTIIPSALNDMYKKISETQAYTEKNPETGVIEAKHGKGLKLLTISLEQNNTNDEEDTLSLGDLLTSNAPSPEDKYISRSNILNELSVLTDNPIELMCFLAKHIGISSDEMIAWHKATSYRKMLSKLAASFGNTYDVPDVLKLVSRYTEEELTYKGKMDLKKVFDNARSSSNAKVKKYVLSHK